MEFRKKFKLELKDYTDFYNYHNKKIYLIFPIIIILFILYVIISGTTGSEDEYVTYITVLVILLAISLLLPLQLKIISKKQYNSIREMRAENEVVLNDNGIQVSNEFGSHKAEWQDIFKAAESAKTFIIYISKLQAHIIPKRFVDPSEEGIIRELIKQHLPPKKYHLTEK